MPTREVQTRHDSRLFAELCAALLRRGHHVQFRVQGASMQPNLLDGDDVLVAPVSSAEIQSGDVAFVETSHGLRVHRVNALSATGITTRGDAGLENDPAALHLYGKVLSRRRGSHEESLSHFQTRLIHPLRTISRRLQAAAASRLRKFVPFVTG